MTIVNSSVDKKKTSTTRPERIDMTMEETLN